MVNEEKPSTLASLASRFAEMSSGKKRALLAGATLATLLAGGFAASKVSDCGDDPRPVPPNAVDVYENDRPSWEGVDAPDRIQRTATSSPTALDNTSVRTTTSTPGVTGSGDDPEDDKETAPGKSREDEVADRMRKRGLETSGHEALQMDPDLIKKLYEGAHPDVIAQNEALLNARDSSWYGFFDGADGFRYVGQWDAADGMHVNRRITSEQERTARRLAAGFELEEIVLDDELQGLLDSGEALDFIEGSARSAFYGGFVPNIVSTARAALNAAGPNRNELLKGLLAMDSNERAFGLLRLAILHQSGAGYELSNGDKLSPINYMSAEVFHDRMKAMNLALSNFSWAHEQSQRNPSYFVNMLSDFGIASPYDVGGWVHLHTILRDHFNAVGVRTGEEAVQEIMRLGSVLSGQGYHNSQATSFLQFFINNAGNSHQRNQAGHDFLYAAGLPSRLAMQLWTNRPSGSSFLEIDYFDAPGNFSPFTGVWGEFKVYDGLVVDGVDYTGYVDLHTRDLKRIEPQFELGDVRFVGSPATAKIYAVLPHRESRGYEFHPDALEDITRFCLESRTVQIPLGAEYANRHVQLCVYNDTWEAAAKDTVRTDGNGTATFEYVGHVPPRGSDGILVGAVLAENETAPLGDGAYILATAVPQEAVVGAAVNGYDRVRLVDMEQIQYLENANGRTRPTLPVTVTDQETGEQTIVERAY